MGSLSFPPSQQHGTRPDTPENQAESPQSRSQKPGVGWPIARAMAILSPATATVLDVAVGPYSGQETGETALLRSRLDSFSPDDRLVADRDFCSFFLRALLLGRGVQSGTRRHQQRHVDFRRGCRLGKRDPLVVWTRPQRPQWMDQATYDTIPETMELRELRFHVSQPGCRTTEITIATTLTDADRRGGRHEGRPRRTVRLPPERGTRHPRDPAESESEPRALPVAGDGAAGIVDDATGL